MIQQKGDFGLLFCFSRVIIVQKQMKEQLRELVNTHHTFTRYLNSPKCDPLLKEYVEKSIGDSIIEKVYNAIHDSPEHKCQNCGKDTPLISMSSGYRKYCNQNCINEHVKTQRKVEAIKQIEDFGFTYIGGYTHNKAPVQVKNNKCGHEFTVSQAQNLFTNPDYCPICGAAIKKAKITARNIAGAKPRAYREKFSEYRKLINLITARTYREHKQKINPNDLPMGRIDTHETPHHVDHIVSVKTCFELGVEPERCASVENLRVMPALDNMRKYSKLTEEAKALLCKWGFA